MLRQSAGQRDPLLLATGQFVGPTVGHVGVEGDAVHQLKDALGAGRTGQGQAETDVRRQRHVREQRAVLRDVADLPLIGRHCVAAVDQRLAVEGEAAAVGKLEAGDHPQQRGLAGTGGADDHRAAAGRHVEADVVERLLRAEGFTEVVQFESVHRPAVRLDW